MTNHDFEKQYHIDLPISSMSLHRKKWRISKKTRIEKDDLEISSYSREELMEVLAKDSMTAQIALSRIIFLQKEVHVSKVEKHLEFISYEDSLLRLS